MQVPLLMAKESLSAKCAIFEVALIYNLNIKTHIGKYSTILFADSTLTTLFSKKVYRFGKPDALQVDNLLC